MERLAARWTELALEEPVPPRPYQPTLERHRSARLVRLRSFDVVSLHHRPGDEGVLVTHGDQGGGYVLFVEDGRLRLTYHAYGDLHRLDVPVPLHGHLRRAGPRRARRLGPLASARLLPVQR